MRRLNGWLHAALGVAIGTCLVAGCIPAPNRARLPGSTGQEGIVRTALPPGLSGATNIAGRAPGVPNVMAPPLQAPSVISNNGGNVLKGSVRAPATIISHNGGNIISNNGGGIVSNNGGGIISHNGGNLQIVQMPLAFTTVRVKDAAGQPVKDDQGRDLVTKTDANGNYFFPVEVKGRNLVIEADVEHQSGKLKSLLPKDGVKAGSSLDVDMTSTLTLAYILDQYVKGDLNTFERLPKDIEAKARVVTEEAIVEKQIALPTTLDDGAIVAKVDEVRKAEPKVDQVFEEIKRLLVIAGITNEGDGLPGTQVDAGAIGGAVADADGNLYVFSQSLHTLWKLTPDGILHTVVPKGAWGYAEVEPEFYTPGYTSGIQLMGDGSLILADTYNNRIVQISATKQVKVLAGTGTAGFSGDGGAATIAQFNRPSGLVRGQEGSLFVSDTENHRVRRISTDGTVETVFGDGTAGYAGDGSAGVAARLNRPMGLAIGEGGELYVADHENSRVRSLVKGVVGTVASSAPAMDFPIALALESDGGLLCLSHRSGRITRLDNNVSQMVYDPIAAERAGFNSIDLPRALCVNNGRRFVNDGMEYFGQLQNSGELSILIGASRVTRSDQAPFVSAYKMAVSDEGHVFVTDMGAQRIYGVDSRGALSLIAGDGTEVKLAMSTQPLDIGIGMVAGIALGQNGELLFSSIGSYTAVRSLDSSSGLKNLVGTGKVDYVVPPIGPALEVNLPNVFDLVQMDDGSIVFAAAQHGYILKLNRNGIVDHLLPLNAVPPSDGLGFPSHLVKDSNGQLLFVEKTRQRISRVRDGRVESVLDDSHISSFFRMSEVNALTVDNNGNIYIASKDKILVATVEKKMKLIAGVGSRLLNGTTRDGGIHEVRDIDVTPAGDLYILEPQQLKKVTAAQLNAL